MDYLFQTKFEEENLIVEELQQIFITLQTN